MNHITTYSGEDFSPQTPDVELIDNDMLICEFGALMKKKVFDHLPTISSRPTYEFRDFIIVENEFLDIFTRGDVEYAKQQ